MSTLFITALIVLNLFLLLSFLYALLMIIKINKEIIELNKELNERLTREASKNLENYEN